MKKLFLLITCCFTAFLEIQAQAVQWALLQDICPPTSWVGASAPHIVSDGDDLISVGSITSSLILGGQTMSGFNGRNNYLAKHDQNGNLLWAKHLVGAVYDSKIITDANKNIIVAGAYRDSLFIGSLIFTNPGTLGGLFIAKFNPSGTLLWARTSNQSTTGYIVDIIPTTDSNGNIYIAGGYYNNFSAGSTTINSLGVDDIFLLKYDPNGNIQWLNSFGTVGADRNASVIGGLTNDVYLAYSSRIQGYTPLAGPNGYYLKKINTGGVEQWSNFVSRRLVYYPANLSRDASDNVYLAGIQDSVLTFGSHTINFTGNDHKTFLAKANSSGNWKWAKQIPYNQTALSYVKMASEKKNELSLIRYNYSWASPSGHFQIAKLDTSGTIIKSNNFTTGLPGTTVQTNFYFFNYSATDNAGNTYLSGGVAGNNVLGSFNLNAPPAILGPALASPSAAFIAKILENSNTVTGNLFIDLNGNGAKDPGEKGYENGFIGFMPGSGHVSTDTIGNYKLYLPPGNVTLAVSQPADHYTFSPQNHSVSFAGLGQVQTKDFALVPIPNRNDVKISVTNITPARPGFELKYLITYQNVGTTTLSDSIRLTYQAPQLTYLAASVAPAHQQTGKLQWFYHPLAPTEKRTIEVRFTVAATTPINTLLNTIASIKPLTTDHIIENNQDDFQHPVTGSFDPNDKQVNFSALSPASVANQDLLDYVIRFQNTGNDTAFTVVVRDSISANLEMGPFELLSASHPYTFRLLENGQAEWRFSNILLPDSNRNEPASHGFIRYRMKPKNNLVIGDEIKSRAAIYFDYNSPVLTNYAITVVADPLGTGTSKTGLPDFKLYPNPARNYVMVAAEFKKNLSAKVTLVNMLGQVISEVTLPANNQIHYQMPLKDLPKGVYIIQLHTEAGRQTQRLVVQ